MVLASIFGPLDGLERSPNRGTGRDASLNAFGLTKPLTIARGRLDDHRTGLSFSAGRSIVDHGFCDTVLDAASGIEVFEFAEQVGLQPSLCSIGTRFRGGVFPINWSSKYRYCSFCQ